MKAGVKLLVSLAKAGDEAGVRLAFQELVPESRLSPSAKRPLPANVIALRSESGTYKPLVRQAASGTAPADAAK